MDFNSRNGFQTAVWGPPLWHILHIISFNYPPEPTPEDKRKYYNFLVSLREVLPCVYCRNNFFDNLGDAEFCEEVFDSRDSFSRFIHKLHDQVNTMLGKPCTDSYEDVRQMFEYFRAGCGGTKAAGAKEKGCTTAQHKAAIGKSRCALYILPRTDGEASPRQEQLMRPTPMGRAMFVDPKCRAIQTKASATAPASEDRKEEEDPVNGLSLVVPSVSGGAGYFV